MSGLAAVAVSFLLGSVPFAVLAGRARGVDLRRIGSGNPGATNAIRALGPGLGIPVLLADMAKGLVAVVWVPRAFGTAGVGIALGCAVAAVAGHVLSPWLRFRGGKGVAAAAGAFLGLAPGPTGIALAVFVVVLLASRFVSLASMAGAAALGVVLFVTDAPRPVAWVGAALAALVVWRHRSNLGRLVRGTENRLQWRPPERPTERGKP